MQSPGPTPDERPRRDHTLHGQAPRLPGLSTPGARLGPYALVGELGRGGMGVVFLARDPAGRDVALKTLLAFDPHGLARFRREAEALAALDHPGIVKVHAAGEADGRPYLVCELIEGARPFDVATASLPLDDRARLVRDACRALGHAHAQGIVHRDVKPDNLLVGADGRVRVTDFGLALLEDRERLTRTGAMVGTPLMMAPEQLTASRSAAGPAADVWSLGVVLYQALTGALPFDGQTLPELCARIDAARPVPPRQRARAVSASLEAVCLRALARAPTERWADGSAMADALDAALRGERVTGPRRRGRWRAALLASAGLAALVLLAAAATAALAPRGPPGPPGAPVVARAAPPRSELLAPALRTTDLEHESLAGWTLVPTPVDRLEVVAFALAGEQVELRVESSAPDLSTAEPVWTRSVDTPLAAGTSRHDVPLVVGWNVITLRAPRVDRVLDRRDVVRLAPDLELVAGTEVRARVDGSSLRLVPPGVMRRPNGTEPARVRVLAPYFLGTYEVSNADFARYRATGVVPAPELPLSDDDLPVRNVAEPDVYGYCDWAGLRLPTHVEWRHAAVDQAAGNVAGLPFEGACPVADRTIAGARARWGHWHLVGNACELVQYLPVATELAEGKIPGALGGSHEHSFAGATNDERVLTVGVRHPDSGFRVARGVGPDRGEFYKVGW
jgi:hypothetical protein